MRSLAVYGFAAALAVLAGFGLSLDTGLGDSATGLWHRFFAGDAAVWTTLLVIGLLLCGKRLLWLLLLAPFAYLLHVALFVVVVLVALTAWQ